MPFVVDASVAASWFLPDEHPGPTDVSFGLLKRDYAVVPSLWWFEIRNVFVTNERRGRLQRAQTDSALAFLADASIEHDGTPPEKSLLDLARRHRLSVYDTAYLELARRRQVGLATLDRALINAARAEQVPLIGG